MGSSVLKYIIVSEKSWNKNLIERLSNALPFEWILIDNKDDFNFQNVKLISPTAIFIPHWSYIIPQELYEGYPCIVFHMTDLPYGRGGSPLQNLIIRGFKSTMISALKVVKELDAGDIYLKKELSLNGSAQDIFVKADAVIEEMIIEIVQNKLQPTPQLGVPYIFKRRRPEDGNIAYLDDTEKVYDFIRMLDADGYPSAFLETEHFKFEFTDAQIQNDKTITANVRITKK